MKTILLLALCLFTPTFVRAQGQINFANTSTTLITTYINGVSAPISPAGAFTIGFYAGPIGSVESSLTLVGTALNGALGGRFSGGNPYTLPSPGFPAGTPIAFQIRVWETAAGPSYEAAAASSTIWYFIGESAMGFVTPTAPPSTIPGIFGTGAGQVGGIILAPVPEPSVVALGLLGLVAMLIRRKCSR